MNKENLLFQLTQLKIEGKKVDPMLTDTWEQIQEGIENKADEQRSKRDKTLNESIGKMYKTNTHP